MTPSPSIVMIVGEIVVMIVLLAIGGWRAWKIVGPVLKRLEIAAEEAKREASAASAVAAAVNVAVNNVPPGTPPLVARVGAIEVEIAVIASALHHLSETVSGSMQDLNDSVAQLSSSLATLQRLVLAEKPRGDGRIG